MSISGLTGALNAWAAAGASMESASDHNSNSLCLPGRSHTSSGGMEDRLTLSAEARQLQKSRGAPGSTGDTGLTEAQRREVEHLKEIDRRVRAHEQAHLAAAGGLAKGPPHFEYVTGPDGRHYAVGGEVSIDTSSVPGNPEATLQKARQIERAATAPGDPSSQDEQVAAAAAEMAQESQSELSRKGSAASGSLISVFA